MGACRTVNDLIWKEIQEKNAQFKADNDAYWEAEQVYRKWYAEERKRRYAVLLTPFLPPGLIRQTMHLPLHRRAHESLPLRIVRVTCNRSYRLLWLGIHAYRLTCLTISPGSLQSRCLTRRSF